MTDYHRAGARLVSLCPQLPKFNTQISQQLDLQFPVLQDRDNAIATLFGLTLETPSHVIEAEKTLGLDLPPHNGNDNWNLPITSRFAIDRDLIIQYASSHVDHRQRSDPVECLEILLNQNV